MIGYYFDENGWFSMYFSNDMVYMNSVPDDIHKTIDCQKKFYLIENNKFKTIIFPNNTSINIFSNYKIDNTFAIFDFKNIHKIFFYDTESIQESINTKKLLYFFENILFWNIGIYDIETLRQQSFQTLNELDLFSPLYQREQHISGVYDQEFHIWQKIMHYIYEIDVLSQFSSIDIKDMPDETKLIVLHQFNQFMIQNKFLLIHALS